MTELKKQLKQLIIDTLDLEDISAEDIDSAEPLFVDGLGLDSIDALELGLALQKRYGIKLEADSEETRRHFASIDALAELVANHAASV
ncbi:phosphopantetheine-binding protein [Pseudomaricurvus sp. HS19]|uniref:phosphopantetheine-binding protein n=1 Tax=Pseudomaricurvus sp. HS19 TaxID=2692626 RepID=UPI00136C1D7E|nr:phosphopantetheine-binding protein [Pseudomaricurvus sp. HS19]MYM63986.1 acyl carrier protein [Pseudomaricurvus sp. HS19]